MKSLQCKILLLDISPAIWRRILVPEEMSLARLHSALQIAFGWENSHLHRFVLDGVQYSDLSFGLDKKAQDEKKTRLLHLKLRNGSRFLYEYDFGDLWQHEVEVEETLVVDKSNAKGVCLAGARRCPPEDCGGPQGYTDLLRAIANPTTEEDFERLDWIGSGFDPEWFDLASVNRKLGVKRVKQTAQS